jgi:DNA-binding MarR family transcriptional regulator
MRLKSRQSAEFSLPVLLRAARRTYAAAVSESLATAGFEDIPRNGVFVMGAISRADAPLGDIIQWLGVSKQAAGQLVDLLVLRGYVAREVDPQDRRRLKVNLTEHGRAAAAIARSAVERVDERLVKAVGRERIAHARATLQALIGLAPTLK